MTNESELRRLLLDARAIALKTMPYFTAMLLSMAYRIDPRVLGPPSPDHPDGFPTMAVTEDGKLLAHPSFLEEVSQNGGPEVLAFVVLHEVLHLVHRHPTRARKLREREAGQFDRDRSAVAMDLSINPSLRALAALHEAAAKNGKGTWRVREPKGPVAGVYPDQFKLKDGLRYEDYYALLKDIMPPPPPQGRGPGQGCAPEEAGKASGQGVPGWSDVKTEHLLRQVQTAAKAHEAAHGRGSVPAGLLLALDEAVKPPKVDWRRVLRSLVHHAGEHRRGAEDAVWTVPSRRQAGVGHGPGVPRMPGTVEYVPRGVLVGDTSGSMGGELQKIASEAAGVVEATGANLRFLAADTTVYDGGEVTSARDVIAKLKGGGGTDMKPALEAAARLRPDFVILVTDGETGSIGGPLGCPLIVCLVRDCKQYIQYAVNEGWAQFVECWDEE